MLEGFTNILLRLFDFSLPIVTVLIYFRRSILELRFGDLVSGLLFYIGDSGGWNLGLPFYLTSGDKIFGTYRIAHRIGGLLVVCGSLIQVCGYWGFHMLWGFVLCIEALFSIPRGWRGGAAPPGAVGNVIDMTRALMTMILPVYMSVVQPETILVRLTSCVWLMWWGL